jgi:hypothetical protein
MKLTVKCPLAPNFAAESGPRQTKSFSPSTVTPKLASMKLQVRHLNPATSATAGPH